jgi:hypothetical protein
VEWPQGEKEPTQYFLSDLPQHDTLRRLVQVVKSRRKIEQDDQQLKAELGLDPHEGRRWTGWHHHGMLVMLAPAFLSLEKLRSKKLFDGPCPRRAVRSNTCCSPGPHAARIVAVEFEKGIELHNLTLSS